MFKGMAEYLLERNLFYISMAAVCFIGIMVKLCLGNTYRRYIRGARDIATTDKGWIKQMRMRFEALYKLNIGVRNTDVFVKRFIAQNRFMGILLSAWDRIGTFSGFLCVILGVSGSFATYITNGLREDTVLHLFCGIWALTIVKMAESITDIKSKKYLLLTMLQDYFENMLKIRLEREGKEKLSGARGHGVSMEAADEVAAGSEAVPLSNLQIQTATDRKQEKKQKKEADRQKKIAVREEKRQLKEMRKQGKKEVRERVREQKQAKAQQRREKKEKKAELWKQQRESRKETREQILLAKKEARSTVKAERDKEAAKRLVSEAREMRRDNTKPVSITKNEETLIEDVLKEFLA